MDIRCVTADGVRQYRAEELTALPAAGGGARRNPVPKVHVYPGHVFIVLHGPERGAHGHVHYLELDQFVGPDWVVTVHGPLNPAVPLDAALAAMTPELW